MASAGSTNMLLLGCEAVGKTLLSRRIRASAAGEPLKRAQMETASTTGQELETFAVPGMAATVTLREVGSPMIPLWASYLAACTTLIFVVDLSQPGLIAASSAELCALLADKGMRDTPCVVILNKMDALHRLTAAEATDLLGLHELALATAKDGITLHCFACSAVTGTGIGDVLELLQQLARGEMPAADPATAPIPLDTGTSTTMPTATVGDGDAGESAGPTAPA